MACYRKVSLKMKQWNACGFCKEQDRDWCEGRQQRPPHKVVGLINGFSAAGCGIFHVFHSYFAVG